ncbi:OLC1v1018926C2 [Oldenlandia corymbosa var. corymbosa]|nr:OLC1v1018926C2 [Oldenlandia corymbosa var. corymbosa]
MEKVAVKELGSSEGTGLLRSTKSEDEVFADAVTEFSDSGLSPGVEDPLERGGKLQKSAGKELAYDLDDSQQTKGDGTAGTGNTRNEEEAVVNATTQLENNEPSSDFIVKEASAGVDQIYGQLVKTSEVASENNLKSIDLNVDKQEEKASISSELERDVELKESVMEVECSTGHVAPGMLETEGPKLVSATDDLKEKGSEHVLDTAVPEEDRKALDGVILEHKLHEADMKKVHSAAGGEIAEQEQELSAETGNVIVEPVPCKVSTLGDIEPEKDQTMLTVEVASAKSVDSSGTSQVEAVNTTLGNDHYKQGEDDFKGEGSEETLLVSISEDLPVTENPEILLQDFKDYRVLKSTLDLGNTEVTTRSVESGEKLLSEPDPSAVSSMTAHSEVSSSENLQKGDVLEPVEEEVDTSGLQGINEEGSGSNALETQHIAKPEVSHFGDDKSSQNESTVEVENGADIVTNKSDHVTAEGRTIHSNNISQKYEDGVIMEATQGLEIGNNSELNSSGAVGVVSVDCPENVGVVSVELSEASIDTNAQIFTSAIGGLSESNPEGENLVSEKISEDSLLNEPVPISAASAISEESSAAVEDVYVKDSAPSEPSVAEPDDKLTLVNSSVSAVDDPIVSSSRTESLEGNWGSVSVLSTQSDGTTVTDADALSTAAQAPEKSADASSNQQTATDTYHNDKLDVYEPPSFLSLVDSQSKLNNTVAAPETKTLPKTEPSSSEAAQAGWIPSLTNVTNESEGRKKNEELIAKVTNWSSGKQHSPLKNLLNEAQAETKLKTAPEKQLSLKAPADETASRNNGAGVTTVSSIMGSETPVHDASKREMEKEWNSPARYPTEIKKEKKKSKPYWVPFVCCSSVHRDM